VKKFRTLTQAAILALAAVVIGAAAGGALTQDRNSAQARLYSFGSTLIAMMIMGKRFPF
jgi:urea transporter